VVRWWGNITEPQVFGPEPKLGGRVSLPLAIYIWLVILRLASWLGFHVRCLIQAAITSQISLAYLHSSKGKWGEAFSSHFFLHGFHEVSENRILKPTHLVGSIHRTNYTLMGWVLNCENFTIYWDAWSYHVGKLTILKPKLD
jgi:hypothetical protein